MPRKEVERVSQERGDDDASGWNEGAGGEGWDKVKKCEEGLGQHKASIPATKNTVGFAPFPRRRFSRRSRVSLGRASLPTPFPRPLLFVSFSLPFRPLFPSFLRFPSPLRWSRFSSFLRFVLSNSLPSFPARHLPLRSTGEMSFAVLPLHSWHRVERE